MKQKQLIIGDGTNTKIIYNEEVNVEYLIIMSPVKFTEPVYADHAVLYHVPGLSFNDNHTNFNCVHKMNIIGVLEVEKGFCSPDFFSNIN
ncbi:MAG: hypothetical protein K0R02_772 [Rickettsiaceae bacterium]|jgi:hypothetical protein|nr:hypothetical protein [Rickettsiaceae bacterium]